MTQTNELVNPFVGLRPYESSNSLYYFGRNEQTKTLLRLLHQHRFVSVVGSSGAGKSSLIRAGLIPQLEAGFLVQERDQWLVATVKPGDSPLANLIDSLLDVIPNDAAPTTRQQQCEELVADIEEHGTQALIETLTPALANNDCNLFILIDQFEELFRFGLEKGQTAQRQQAEQFVALLLSLSRNKLPIYVCLTMRSDFLGDCDAFYGLPEAINKSQFLVPRLTRGQRQEVITNPVNLAGANIAPRLVDKLLNESIDTRDDLPILQHALMRTWDVWQADGEQGSLDIEHYEKAHTIHYALDRHADEALDDLSDEQLHIAKILFQALTTVDAGNRRIRRPAHLNDIAAIANTSPKAVMDVIACFCEQNRSFLVLSSEDSSENPLIDISHESLIRQWATLDDWVNEESENAETYQRLVDTAQRFRHGAAEPLKGVELEHATAWQETMESIGAPEVWAKRYDTPDTPNSYGEATAFIKLSQIKETKQQEAEKAEQDRQAQLLKDKAELEEQKRVLAEHQAQEQRKALIKNRWLSGVMTMLAVIMLGVAWFAFHQSQDLKAAKLQTESALEATQQAKSATEEALATAQKNEKAAKEAEVKAQHHAQMAEQATEAARTNELASNFNLAKAFEEKSLFSITRGNSLSTDDPYHPDAINEYRNALLYALETQQRPLAEGKAAIKPATLGQVSRLPNHTLTTEQFTKPHIQLGNITTIAYSPDGKVIASGSHDNTIRLWNAQSGQTINTLKGHASAVLSIAYSPDGKVIASGASDNTIRLWNAQSGQTINTLKGHSESVYTIAYSPDGKVIASGSSDNTIRLWNAQSGQTINTLKGHASAVLSIAYSPDGKVIASGSSDNTIRLWNAQSGEIINTLKGHASSVTSIAYSPDGKILASGSDDNTIRLWNAQSGETINTLKGHSGSVTSIAYSPDGKTIAANDGASIRLWQPDDQPPLYRFVYDFDAIEVSGALRFLWELELEDLNFKHTPRPPALIAQLGFHITWTDETRKYRPLLDMPAEGETKMDQVVRWLEERCAYKEPEKYGCTPKPLEEAAAVN